MKHDVFVGLDVIHVNSFHFFLTFRMETEAIPADMREEKSSAEIQRILDRFSEFVMHAVNLNPVVNFKIKCNYIKWRLDIDKQTHLSSKLWSGDDKKD